MDEETPQFEQVVAGNIARLRVDHHLTQEHLSDLLRFHGLQWDRVTVAMVESGRRQLRLIEAVAICGALGVPMTDLCRPQGTAVAMEAGTWATSYLIGVLTGEADDLKGFTYTSKASEAFMQGAFAAAGTVSSIELQQWKRLCDRWEMEPKITVRERRRIMHRDDQLEIAIAERIEGVTHLGVTPGEVALASERTWGRSLADEHDRRTQARAGNRRAVKGRVTRELEKELTEAIERAADRAAERKS